MVGGLLGIGLPYAVSAGLVIYLIESGRLEQYGTELLVVWAIAGLALALLAVLKPKDSS